jgi:hypothetical protein
MSRRRRRIEWKRDQHESDGFKNIKNILIPMPLVWIKKDCVYKEKPGRKHNPLFPAF